MAGDFTIPAITIFSPNTVILSGQVNTNNTAIRTAHNNAFNALTGHQHTGAVGDGPNIPATSVIFLNNPVNPEVKSIAPSTGKAVLAYGPSNSVRTVTIPDSGANASFVMTEGAQTINGQKTFITGTMRVGGGGAGVATIQNATTATSRVLTTPDPGANADFVMTAGAQSIGGVKTFTSEIELPDVDPPGAANRVNQNGIVKAWAYYDDNIGLSDNYNITSVTDDDGDGFYVVNLDRDMASSQYPVLVTARSGVSMVSTVNDIVNAGTFEITFLTLAGASGDTDFMLLAAGDQ